MIEVETRTIAGRPAAIGSAGGHTLVVDLPADAGGEGIGFNGGELLYLAIAGCVSNDGDATPERLRDLVELVDRIAEIPGTVRAGTDVRLSMIGPAGPDSSAG